MIPLPKGFTVAGVRCGLKNKRNDLGLIVSDRPARAAGVFTTNHVRASCVDYSRKALEGGFLRAIVVNSGNANCCNGVQGERDTRRMAELTAEELAIDSAEIAVGSTGVIGHLLDIVKVEKGIHDASQKLGVDVRAFMDAILTTDLVEKWAWANPNRDDVVSPQVLTQRQHVDLDEGLVIGFAKGSGMIGPNMATMLGYVITDLDVEGLDLPAILKRAADVSFNCMTVDGDTSTNDMLIVMANGASGVKATEEQFESALRGVCTSLAKQVAREEDRANDWRISAGQDSDVWLRPQLGPDPHGGGPRRRAVYDGGRPSEPDRLRRGARPVRGQRPGIVRRQTRLVRAQVRPRHHRPPRRRGRFRHHLHLRLRLRLRPHQRGISHVADGIAVLSLTAGYNRGVYKRD